MPRFRSFKTCDTAAKDCHGGVGSGLMRTALVSAAIVAGAGSGAWAQDADVPPDLLGKWKAVTIDGNAVVEGADSTIEFEEAGAVDGNGGCNTLFGPLMRKGTFIKIGPLAVTRKACAPDILKQEAAFVKALEASRDFRRELEAKSLILLNAQGQEIMQLTEFD